MKPLKLYLKGFKGVRDGIGRAELSLDLEALTGDAQLVALVGPNGTGKTTIMDNLHPYRIMPSRATSYSVNGFSYYDHLCSAEAVKDLEWTAHGRRFRSQLIFRVNGTRRTEAYVHVMDEAGWTPMALPDGTLSDGKTDTYDRCIEHVLGTPEAFFTSVFSAQNRRPLSAYKTGEIKVLMIELLRLDRIKAAGEKAAAVVNLLKVALSERRGNVQALERARAELAELQGTVASASASVEAIEHKQRAAKALLERARTDVANRSAEAAGAEETEKRRARLALRIADAQAAAGKALQSLQAAQSRQDAKLARLREEQRSLERSTDERRTARQTELAKAHTLLAKKGQILEAVQAADRLQHDEAVLHERLALAKQRQQEAAALRQEIALNESQKEGKEREAGAAALRAAGLRTRFGLTSEVPCRDTEMQEQCKLLGDAREAKTLLPSAEADIARIRDRLSELAAHKAELQARLKDIGEIDQQVRVLESELAATNQRRRAAESVANLRDSLEAAERRAVLLAREIGDIDADMAEQSAHLAAEIERGIVEAAELERQIAEGRSGEQAAIAELCAELAAMPPAFDRTNLERAERALADAQQTGLAIDAEHVAAVARLATLRARCHTLETTVEAGQRAAQNAAALESEIANWSLLAKALSNDGIIALCIDDAGPALARLTNDLLLSCYGARFSVAITTQIETAKKDLKEGFDVIVFDAESGESKSVGLMSGGQKVWINECLTRAIAIYLTQTSGQRYQTLFTDEVDGPLDPDRKRMLMAMKRAVLSSGGYEREFFVSQTPELWAMADRAIDIGALASA